MNANNIIKTMTATFNTQPTHNKNTQNICEQTQQSNNKHNA